MSSRKRKPLGLSVVTLHDGMAGSQTSRAPNPGFYPCHALRDVSRRWVWVESMRPLSL